MGMEGVLVKQLEEALRPWYKKAYEDAPESAKIIVQHCGIAGACGLFPIPYADLLILLPSQIVMYGRLNKQLGITLSDNTMHVIGKFMLSQIAGVIASIPVAFAAKVGAGLLKLIPGAGTMVGAFMDAGANAAVTYVLGIVYLKALVKAKASGKVSEENLREALNNEMSDKDNIRDMYKDARNKVRGMDFKKYKDQAEDYVEDGK